MTRTQITNKFYISAHLQNSTVFSPSFLIKIGTPKIRQEPSVWEKFVLIQRKTYLYCQYTRKIRTVTTAFTHMNANTPFIPFISWVLLFMCITVSHLHTFSLPITSLSSSPKNHYFHLTFIFSPFTFQDEALILLSWCMVVVNTLTYK